MNKYFIFRILGVLAIISLFVFCFQFEHRSTFAFLDLPAALLVICVPPLVLFVFNPKPPPIKNIWGRFGELRQFSNDELQEDLESQSAVATQPSGLSRILSWSTNHPDQFVRYGARIITSKYQKDELSHLLTQRMMVEDRKWQRLVDDVGFLAKTAPYNGMLATVIGMLNMLRTLEDFSRITTSVGLALFGTLYGLILFLMVYSPLQKLLIQARNEVRRRNEMIARWFIHVSEKRDTDFIKDSLDVISPVRGEIWN